MPSTVEKLNPTRVKLTIEMPFVELQPKIDAAYKQIAEQVNLPGFRRGHVPARLIDQRFGRGSVLQQAINDAIPEAYGKAVQDNELFPLGQPDIEVSKLEDGDVVELTAEVDVRPEFDIPEFSGLKVEVEPAKVDDKDVDERVKLLRERFANLKEVKRAAKTDDVVNFDLSASQNGEPVPDAESNGMQYRIGAGGMVDGLDDALVGMKAGDDKTFTSQLIGGSHGGQDVDIKVTVNKVNEQELPALDADFAQLVSEFDTVEEMRADLRENLERMARIGQANEARDKIVEKIVEKVSFELPPAVLEADVKGYHEQIESQLNQSGLTVEQYLAEAEDEKASTPEEFWEEIDQRAEQGLRAQIVLDKLAEEQNVGVSQEEFTQLIMQKAQQNGTSPEQELQHMSEHNHMPEWMSEVRRGKALNTIVDEAVVTDTKGKTVELKNLQADGTIAEPAADEADKAPAKKTAAKKPAAKKAPAKKADDKKADDKAPTKKAAAKKADDAKSGDKAPAKKPAAKKAPAKKAADK